MRGVSGTAVGIAWDIWRAERGGPEGIARRQQARLAELVGFARSASPFYRHLYRDVPDDVVDVRQLPRAGKRELMENFDDWVTDPHITLAKLKSELLSDLSQLGRSYRGKYLVVTTSGTSGEPAVLVHDRTSWVVVNLVVRIRERRTLVRPGEVRRLLRHGLRAAALVAGGGHFAGVVLTESARRRAPVIARRVRVFSVLRPLPELVAELNAFNPTLLYGYPSAMIQLAAEQQAGRLRIRPVLAISSGENLSATGRAAIEASLGCRVTDRYLSSEVPALTSLCRNGAFHVNADWYILEPVDANYQPVPAGVTSHTVLVTNLANRVQPIIRYDLGDRVTLAASPCPCGSPFPAVKIEGRAGDLVSFAAPDGRAVTVLPLALGTVIEETAGVRRFQAIRTGPRTLRLRLETGAGRRPGAGADGSRGATGQLLRGPGDRDRSPSTMQMSRPGPTAAASSGRSGPLEGALQRGRRRYGRGRRPAMPGRASTAGRREPRRRPGGRTIRHIWPLCHRAKRPYVANGCSYCGPRSSRAARWASNSSGLTVDPRRKPASPMIRRSSATVRGVPTPWCAMAWQLAQSGTRSEMGSSS